MKYSFTVTNIYVFRSSRKNIAYLHFNQKKVKGFVGYKGIGKKLREGDMITPLGTFSFLEVYYRPDKNNKFKTILPKKKIFRNSRWCVDSRSNSYNSPVNSANHFKCEKLFRKDCLYDILIVINYNIKPAKPFKGSAIFIHCYDGKTKYTEGCLALKKQNIYEILELIRPNSRLIIC